ncbi:biosynthetic-type acetolactate synthase large subunit [bacterium]|nr:biosynthetic-type acetolactate synthase large subunit [bacterium]
MKLSGAKILIESLKEEKVEVIFGFPGGVLLDVYDELYATKEIRHILVRHEQGAAHAADGYARATGKVGVCLATSGPGATNLVTGIATAYMDSIPLVALTGQVLTSMIGNDAFQEADIVGITRPITKYNYLVRNVADLAQTIKEAFYIASTGKPGPVLIDLPKDVMVDKTNFLYPEKADIKSYKPTYAGNIKQIKKAAEAINGSKKPVLYIGGGVIASQGANIFVKELAEKNDIPVTVTLMGKGGFPDNHRLSLNMLGMHGTQYANHAIMASDLIIAVGARFDDRITGKVSKFAPHASVIHIDIDPTAIGKNVKTDIPIVGDVKRVLEELIKYIKQGTRKQWNSKIEEWKKKCPLVYKDDGDCIKPQYVVEKIEEVTNGEAIITTEVGQNQMWAAQFFRYTKPRTFISSGGLGTMGFGFPAAIGAKVGCPDKIVFDIAGDGSFQMNIQELGTAVKNNINVKVAILNNGCLGMVRQWQELFYKKRYSHTILDNNPDFVKIAEAYGAKGLKITRKKDVEGALKEAIKTDAPFVIDFRVAPEENVFPMVPAGASLTEMLSGLA